MQDRSLNQLIDTAMEDKYRKNPAQLRQKVNKIEKDNREALEKVLDERDYNRIPNSDELEKIRQWAENYAKNNKNASRREVRKATQKHFNIRIYK